jgi:hypothetical protein
MHADDPTGPSRIALPAEGRGLLDRDAGLDLARQDVVAVLVRLALEDVRGGRAPESATDRAGAAVARSGRRRTPRYGATVGFCQPPGGVTLAPSAFGPQVPGSYS